MDYKAKGKEGTNAKGQKKENAKPGKVNNKRVNDDKRPEIEKKDSADDISNNFPNFSVLNQEEKLAFFEALSAARKNIEKRGLPTRERFGTVHDEYLQYFARDDKGETVQKKPESAPSARPSESPVPSRKSPKESKLTPPESPKQRVLKTPEPVSPSKKTPKSPQKNLRPESEPNDFCESVIKRDTEQMIQMYLDKKRRIEEQWKKSSQVNKSPTAKPKIREETRPPTRRPANKTENPAPKTPQTSNTPKFQALNPAERKEFFRILREAHTNVLYKNPHQKDRILTLDDVLKPYQAGPAKAAAARPAAQDLHGGRHQPKNLRVKVTLTSGDNKRLCRTKSQVLNDSAKEGPGGKSKSLESVVCPDTSHGKQSKIPILRKAPQERSDIKTETQPVKKIPREDSAAAEEKKTEAAVKDKTQTIKEEPEKKEEEHKKEKEHNKKEEHKKEKEHNKKEEEHNKKEEEHKKEKEHNKKEEEHNKKEEEHKKEKEHNKKEKKHKKKEEKKKDKKKEKKMEEECEDNAGDEAGSLEDTKAELKKLRKEKKEAVKEQKKTLAEAAKKEKELLRKKKKQEFRKRHAKKEAKKKAASKDLECMELKVVGVHISREKCLPEEKKEPLEKKNECECQDLTMRKTNQEKEGECEGKELKNQTNQEKKGESEEKIPGEKRCQKIECLREEEKEEDEEEDGEESEEGCSSCSSMEEECQQSSESQSLTDKCQQSSESQSLTDKCQQSSESQSLTDKCQQSSESQSLTGKCQQSSQSQALTEKCQQQLASNVSHSTAFKEGSGDRGPFSSQTCDEFVVRTATQSTKSLAGVSLLEKRPEETWEAQEMVPAFTTGKVVVVDDNVIERIKDLIHYLERKVNPKDNLQSEYVRLVLSYTEYLTRVTESLILAKKPKKGQKVHSTYAAPEVHLKFKNKSDEGPKEEQKKSRVPHSISEDDFQRQTVPGPSKIKKKENSRRKASGDDVNVPSDSESSSISGEDNITLTPSAFKKAGIPMTKIRLLQDLLKGRAKFAEGSIDDFKIVRIPEAEYVPPEELPKEEAKEITEADVDQGQKAAGMKFFRNLAKLCHCGKKQIEEDAILENLKGEAVRVDTGEEKKNPASATINDSTMEVLKAAERKKIIEKYLKKEQS